MWFSRLVAAPVSIEVVMHTEEYFDNGTEAWNWRVQNEFEKKHALILFFFLFG